MMADMLKKCPACGGSIARNAPKCPHCGAAFTSRLTKVVTVCVVLFVLAVIVGNVIATRQQ